MFGSEVVNALDDSEKTDDDSFLKDGSGGSGGSAAANIRRMSRRGSKPTKALMNMMESMPEGSMGEQSDGESGEEGVAAVTAAAAADGRLGESSTRSGGFGGMVLETGQDTTQGSTRKIANNGSEGVATRNNDSSNYPFLVRNRAGPFVNEEEEEFHSNADEDEENHGHLTPQDIDEWDNQSNDQLTGHFGHSMDVSKSARSLKSMKSTRSNRALSMAEDDAFAPLGPATSKARRPGTGMSASQTVYSADTSRFDNNAAGKRSQSVNQLAQSTTMGSKKYYNLSKTGDRKQFMEVMDGSGQRLGGDDGYVNRSPLYADARDGNSRKRIGTSMLQLSRHSNNTFGEDSDEDEMLVQSFKPRSNSKRFVSPQESLMPSNPMLGEGNGNEHYASMQELLNVEKSSPFEKSTKKKGFCGRIGGCADNTLGKKRTKRRKITLFTISLLICGGIGGCIYFIFVADGGKDDTIRLDSQYSETVDAPPSPNLAPFRPSITSVPLPPNGGVAPGEEVPTLDGIALVGVGSYSPSQSSYPTSSITADGSMSTPTDATNSSIIESPSITPYESFRSPVPTPSYSISSSLTAPTVSNSPAFSTSPTVNGTFASPSPTLNSTNETATNSTPTLSPTLALDVLLDSLADPYDLYLSIDNGVESSMFGTAVAISSDGIYLAVGAKDATNEQGEATGAVYIYLMSGYTDEDVGLGNETNYTDGEDVGFDSETNSTFGNETSPNDSTILGNETGVVDDSTPGIDTSSADDAVVGNETETLDNATILDEDPANGNVTSTLDNSTILTNETITLDKSTEAAGDDNSTFVNVTNSPDNSTTVNTTDATPAEVRELFASDPILLQVIYGVSEYDEFGSSLAFSESHLVIGSRSEGSEQAGVVRIYELLEVNGTETSWIEMGEPIAGKVPSGRFGWSVDISGDGSLVAIGSPKGGASGGGSLITYRYNDGSDGNTGGWSSYGSTIEGLSGEASGYSVSLSNSGFLMTVGSPKASNPEGASNAGKTSVYVMSESQWVLLGQEIYGQLSEDIEGTSVALSDDGTLLVTGAKGRAENGATNAGICSIYEFKNQQWELSKNLAGQEGERLGSSVAISPDGSTVACGGVTAVLDGMVSGVVRVWNRRTSKESRIWPRGGDADEAAFGTSLSISSDGFLVVGAPQWSGSSGESFAGAVQIFAEDLA